MKAHQFNYHGEQKEEGGRHKGGEGIFQGNQCDGEKHPRRTQRRQHHITTRYTFSHEFFPALHGNVDNTSLVVVDIKHSRKIRGSPAAP